MGISLNDQAIFLKKLMDEVRKNIDHVYLVPIFQLFHAQIHALVIAYTKFKNKILQVDNWNPQNRILL